jgi:hypothetical protein
MNIWSWAPDGARHQDLLIDWPSFAMWLWLWLCSFWHPCGGGVEYLDRDLASRRRRRKGSFKPKTVKYGHECQGTRTQERLRWRWPAAYTKDRPVPSSERAPHKNKTVTVKE